MLTLLRRPKGTSSLHLWEIALSVNAGSSP